MNYNYISKSENIIYITKLINNSILVLFFLIFKSINNYKIFNRNI